MTDEQIKQRLDAANAVVHDRSKHLQAGEARVVTEWIAMSNVPIPDRVDVVSGSDVLLRWPGRAMSVYLFRSGCFGNDTEAFVLLGDALDLLEAKNATEDK